MVNRLALDWCASLERYPGQWVDAVLAVGVFPQPDGQVQFRTTMRTFWTEPAPPQVAGLKGSRVVRSHEPHWLDYAPPAGLAAMANLMVDVHGMAPSLAWLHVTDPAGDISIGSGPSTSVGDHVADAREVGGRALVLHRHTKSTPWLTPDMVEDPQTLYDWAAWASGRPMDPSDAHVDGVVDVEPTQEWRTYWTDALEELEPELLSRLSAEQAVAMMLDDWMLVLHRYDGLREQVLACRPSVRSEDPAGASRVLPTPHHRHGARATAEPVTDWTDTPIADGQWVVVDVETYVNYADDDREGRCWAENTPEMRHQLLTEAFESAVVFTSLMNFVEWAAAPTAMSDQPFDERVDLLAALVDLPLPQMGEVKARLAAGAGRGVGDLLPAARTGWRDGTAFPVFVHNVPGHKTSADYEPPADGTEYHLYYRDRDWLAWAGPMRAGAAEKDAVLAYAKDTAGHEARVVEVTTRTIATVHED